MMLFREERTWLLLCLDLLSPVPELKTICLDFTVTVYEKEESGASVVSMRPILSG